MNVQNASIISELFKDEWLTSNKKYGFDMSLSGARIKDMFNKAAKKYCQIMLPGQLDANCEFIGNIYKILLLKLQSTISYFCAS